MALGRNDPCPCGSGAKYKRCCLDRELELERSVAELEGIVTDVGDEIYELDRSWWVERIADFYDGGLGAFGLIGPDPDELFEAYLWFVLDCPLEDGRTPLALRRGESPDRHVELLSRSELRAWRIEGRTTRDVLSAVCPVSGERARLEMIRPPLGDPLPGALLVARSVPLGPERWALLGQAPIVEPEVQREFESMLASLDAPRGEFWRTHGGVIARAAWAWPETRMLTIDGQDVADALVRFAVHDGRAVKAKLDADAALEAHERDPYDGAFRWRLRWSPPAPESPEPAPGVRHERCPEDADDDPWLADVALDADEHQLWLFAPTPARLEHAERLLIRPLGSLVGPVRSRSVEAPYRVPRWKSLRSERIVGRLERRCRPPAGRRAA